MKKSKISSFCSLIALLWVLAACQSGISTPHDVGHADTWPAIYPDYAEVTIPVGIAPLNFSMLSDSITTIDVDIRGSKGGNIHTNSSETGSGSTATFDIEDWHRLTAQNKGGDLTVTVIAEQEGHWTQYRDFTIHVSEDSLDAWGITYRRIAPGYEHYGHMGIYQRCLANFDESALIENTENTSMCVNCHTANQTNPDSYVFHVRGANGATAIVKDGQAELLQAKNEILGGAMVYPYWHPGGRYCAFSTNKTSQMFHARSNKRIEVYDAASDIFVYDTETHRILNDTIVMRKYWAENTPVFSPDGKWLYYITARRQIYPTDYDKERYSLCRISFDATTGKIGQKADTLINTRLTGKSVTWPRPSYDGRYLMYTQVDYGYFSIWHQEADLWLLDLESGETRPLDEVNSNRAESLHSWTTNSRWFLFTSRRDDGLYTRVYLSHIGTDGKATKPFMLPQRDPKHYYLTLLYSYNTTDFTQRPVDTNPKTLMDSILNGQRIPTMTLE